MLEPEPAGKPTSAEGPSTVPTCNVDCSIQGQRGTKGTQMLPHKLTYTAWHA